MKQSELFQKAYDLYEAGRYTDAASAALDVMKEVKAEEPENANELMIEGYVISARALILSSATTTGDTLKKVQELYRNMLVSAVGYATSAEELFAIEMAAAEEYQKARRKYVKIAMEKIEGNPTFDNWKEYLGKATDFLTGSMAIILAIRNGKGKELVEAEGMDLAEASKKYAPNSVDIMIDTDEDKAACAVTAEKIFERACRYHAANNTGSNTEAMKGIIMKVLTDVVIAELMFGYGVPDKGEVTPVQLGYMKQQAMALQFKLDAVVMINGNPMSIYSNDRGTEVQKLRALYNRIKAEDPSFNIPYVEEAAKTLPSGGCYVATAVYGSYNCPQVWTLRRYRDDVLATTRLGRLFIRTYYAVSPTLVKWFGETAWFKKLWRGHLDRMVTNLNAQGVENTPYEDKNW